MVELAFGDLVITDVIMALLTGLAAILILAIAYNMTLRGSSHWKPRKLVHIAMSTVIAFTVMVYSNLSGPAFAAGIFLTILFYAWAHKSDLISDLLLAGSREGESKLNTFASSFMGLISFIWVFLIFFSRPEIFVAAMLAVAWGDASGEIVGRPYGGRFFRKPKTTKSIEGSLAVFFVTLVSLIIAISIFSVDTCPLCIVPQLAIIAFAVTITELLSIGWTDNFLIPFVTATFLWMLVYPNMILFPFVFG